MVHMRPSVDLAELPYVFSQVPLLMPEQFAKQASERGIMVTEQQLEALHQLRLLTPLFRVARSGRALTSAIRYSCLRCCATNGRSGWRRPRCLRRMRR
jgi:hypothetical protein